VSLVADVDQGCYSGYENTKRGILDSGFLPCAARFSASLVLELSLGGTLVYIFAKFVTTGEAG